MTELRKTLPFVLLVILILAPIVNIFLFLKNIYGFNIAAVLYLINIFVLIPLLVFEGKKKSHAGFWIFYLIIIYFIAFLPWGLDMTDETYSLALTHFFPNIKNFCTENCHLSYLISHLWITIPGKPYYIWERLAKVLILASILLLAYKTLKLYNNKLTTNWLATLIIFIISGIISIYLNIAFVPYDNVPILFLALFSYLSLKTFKSKNIVYSIAAGVSFILTIYSRITLFYIAPLVTIILAIRNLKEIKLWIFFTIGLIIGIIIIKLLRIDLLYALRGILTLRGKHLYKTLCIIGDQAHSTQYLINTTLRHIKVTVYSLVFPAIGIFSLQYLFTQKAALTRFLALNT